MSLFAQWSEDEDEENEDFYTEDDDDEILDAIEQGEEIEIVETDEDETGDETED